MPTQRPRQAVILAGGRGTRMRPLTDDRPKPMIEFSGRPFMEYMVELLAEQGFERVLMLLGYLPDVIRDHFGDGSRFGIRIEYSVTDPDDLTGRRLQVADDLLDPLFMLIYCDNYWPLNMERMWDHYQRVGAPAMVTIYANQDGYSKGNTLVGADGLVQAYDRSRTSENLTGVEISYAIFPKRFLALLPADGAELVEEAVYPRLTADRLLGAHVSEHRYYSVGSMHRMPLTEAFFARRPTVILDRDGVLNERPPRAEYVRTPADFQWLDGSLEALRLFTDAGYQVVVISNQAGIGRGVMTESDLTAVHDRMVRQAADAGGRIDAIYHCPHDWDAGCTCRKPSPGMLFEAQHDLQLDLSRTPFIGDDERDGQAAYAAGAPYLAVDDSTSLLAHARRLTASATAAVHA
ncbi:MAG TPA: HAD-IIIA family hydrolase [Candidatus Limnocylindria bacterium]|jgi:D-glycero-D-manno-heptose 1,7-bisphosphate phosphatase|nr:HAD-IIIA family hydrolase [Candidatus Limnocylindria bacterium]